MEKKFVITAAVLILAGIVLSFLGSISLLFGLIYSHYGDHLRYLGFAYSANLLIEFWGIGFIISGVIAGVYASGAFSVKRAGKIALLATGIAALVIGASLSGAIINGSLPPPERMNVMEFSTSGTEYEVNATPASVSFSLYSLYAANFSVNYTYSGKVIASGVSSFSGYYNSSSTFPVVNFSGEIGVILTIWSEGLKESRGSNVTVVPQLEVQNISGPQNINDSSGPVTVSYRPVFTGGIPPFNFTWSIGAFYFGNIQNVTYSSLYGRILNVTYFENPINSNSYGYNVSVDITLTMTDSVGMSSSYENNSAFFSSYFVVNVTGD